MVLVSESKPITSVAYALSTDSYEEELDGWKLRVHNEAVKSVAVEKQNLGGANAISTNWSRAALETSLNVPFKFVTVEMPLHLSLLSGKTSSTLSSTCWELSTIAYYPLQVSSYLLCIPRAVRDNRTSNVDVVLSLKSFVNYSMAVYKASCFRYLTWQTGMRMVVNRAPRFTER